jgi:hypothetical protein
MVLRTVGLEHAPFIATRNPNSAGANRHAGIQAHDRKVHEESERHHAGGGDPSIQSNHSEEEHVGGDEYESCRSTGREEGDVRRREDLQGESDDREAPPVELEGLKGAEGPASEEPNRQRG